jgi:uncharacterized protein
MLWRISGSPLHILGTIHCSDVPLTLPPGTSRILDAAKVIAFETSLDAVPDLSAGFYPVGQRLSDSIPTHLFDKTKSLWSSHELPDDLESRRPWLVVRGLTVPLFNSWGFDFALGIDRAVKAAARGRAAFALEAAGVPFLYMAGAPVSEQAAGLARLVEQPLAVKGEIQAVVDGWRNRDLEVLSSVSARALEQAPVLSAGLFGRRNRAWMPHLLRFARGGKPTTAVVGVLHMVGPDSLVDLLKFEGQTCELVDV